MKLSKVDTSKLSNLTDLLAIGYVLAAVAFVSAGVLLPEPFSSGVIFLFGYLACKTKASTEKMFGAK